MVCYIVAWFLVQLISSAVLSQSFFCHCCCSCCCVHCRQMLTVTFWLSHQKNPCYRSLMKIHQQGAEIFNKAFTFEVRIGLLPLILSHQKNPCYRSLVKIHQYGAEIFNKTCSFEISIGLLTLILIILATEPLL